jgi:hypothetical protein
MTQANYIKREGWCEGERAEELLGRIHVLEARRDIVALRIADDVVAGHATPRSVVDEYVAADQAVRNAVEEMRRHLIVGHHTSTARAS